MTNMLPFVIAGLAALAVVIISIGVAMSAGGGGVASRLERYASSRPEGGDTDAEAGSAVVAGISRALERQDRGAQLATDLARADLKLRPAEFVLIWIATPFAVTALAYFVGFVFIGLQHPVALAIVFLIGLWLPRLFLKYRQRRRLKQFAGQLPDTITLLANSLRAGSSFLQGIELVTREARPPISEEFQRVVREMQLGMALEPALNNLVRRVNSEDLELMVTAINIQAQVGGNLATVLDAIAFTIRERVRIQGEIATLTAMQKYSGYVITLLPVGMAGILFVISPTYIGPMFERPPDALGLPLGMIFFAIGIISMGIGYMLIRRIVDIKV